MGLRTALGLKRPKNKICEHEERAAVEHPNGVAFDIATMNEWYSLAKRHPEYLKAGNTSLKDYGVMRCMDFIEHQIEANAGRELRILEFGHGFNPEVMTRFQNRAEVWGADRPQGLSYFKDDEWPAQFEKLVKPKCPNVRFVRSLIGEADDQFPPAYFDLIYSISVLEEVPLPTAGKVIAAAQRLLRPGGFLFGSYDVRLRDFQQLMSGYAAEHRTAGLTIPDQPNGFDWADVLIENPPAVMLWYMGAEPADGRKYWGHYGSAFTAAQKAS